MWKCGNVEIPIICYDKLSIKLSPKAQEKEVNYKEYLWISFLFSWRSNSLVSSGLWKLESLPNTVCTTAGSRFLPESFLHFAALVTGIGRVTKGRYFSVPSPDVAGWWQALWICKMDGFYSLPNARPIQLGWMVSPQFCPHFPREATCQTRLWALL